MSVYDAFRQLRATMRVSYTPDTMGVPYAGYVTVAAEKAQTSRAAMIWQECLCLENVDPDLARALAPHFGIFECLDQIDMRHAIRGLLRIREDTNASMSNFGFSVSARAILGSSKVLGRLPMAVLKLIGVDQLPSTPRYVVVAHFGDRDRSFRLIVTG